MTTCLSATSLAGISSGKDPVHSSNTLCASFVLSTMALQRYSQIAQHSFICLQRAWQAVYSHEDSRVLSRRWAATLGIVLAISRGFIAEQGMAFEPELALLEVVAHTHWLPRHWRGRGHTREVQEQFQQLFQFKVWRTESTAITTQCRRAVQAGPHHH